MLSRFFAFVSWGTSDAKEAKAIESIRKKQNWSQYVLRLIRSVQRAMRKHSDIDKLRFLLYPSGLLPQHKAEILKDNAGVIWLGKEKA